MISSLDIVEFKKKLRESTNIALQQHPEEFAEWLSSLEELEPKMGMEIGAGEGGSSHAFLEFLPSLDLFVSVDTKKKENTIPNRSLSRKGAGCYCHPDAFYIQGDSKSYSTKDKINSMLDGNKLDFLFIDGDHTFLGVATDFCSYSPLVRDGGLVGIHDTELACMKNRERVVELTLGVHVFWSILSLIHPGKVSSVTTSRQGIGIYRV